MSFNLPADLGIRSAGRVFKHGDSAIEHRARLSRALPIIPYRPDPDHLPAGHETSDYFEMMKHDTVPPADIFDNHDLRPERLIRKWPCNDEFSSIERHRSPI
jgi:hypothetical protein